MDDSGFSPEQWEAKLTLVPRVEKIVVRVLCVAKAYSWNVLWTAGQTHGDVEPSVRHETKTMHC